MSIGCWLVVAGVSHLNDDFQAINRAAYPPQPGRISLPTNLCYLLPTFLIGSGGLTLIITTLLSLLVLLAARNALEPLKK